VRRLLPRQRQNCTQSFQGGAERKHGLDENSVSIVKAGSSTGDSADFGTESAIIKLQPSDPGSAE